MHCFDYPSKGLYKQFICSCQSSKATRKNAVSLAYFQTPGFPKYLVQIVILGMNVKIRCSCSFWFQSCPNSLAYQAGIHTKPLYEPGHEKMCLMSYANNKGADQTAHPRSLISAFVVRSLDSIISLVSRSEISRF